MARMLAAPGHAQGHVPAALVYGPVVSRRFGNSLGISFSYPGAVGCHWQCPYCQLGGGSRSVDARLMASPAEVTAGLRAALQAAQPPPDVVTIAGAGEPLDHPQAVELLTACTALCREWQVPLVLLSNGDGIEKPDLHRAVAAMDRSYLKWDPGPMAGAWRAMSADQQRQRRAALRALPNLRLQSLIFAQRGKDGVSGNTSEQAQRRWLDDMVELNPCEVHLTTADREDPAARCAPQAHQLLRDWAQVLQLRLPRCQVQVFANMVE